MFRPSDPMEVDGSVPAEAVNSDKSQRALIHYLNIYQSALGRPLLSTQGYCQGLSLLWLQKAVEQKLSWFYQTRDKIIHINQASNIEEDIDIEKFMSLMIYAQKTLDNNTVTPVPGYWYDIKSLFEDAHYESTAKVFDKNPEEVKGYFDSFRESFSYLFGFYKPPTPAKPVKKNHLEGTLSNVSSSKRIISLVSKVDDVIKLFRKRRNPIQFCLGLEEHAIAILSYQGRYVVFDANYSDGLHIVLNDKDQLLEEIKFCLFENLDKEVPENVIVDLHILRPKDFKLDKSIDLSDITIFEYHKNTVSADNDQKREVKNQGHSRQFFGMVV